MDRERFDALTRLLGREGSRRAALGAVMGAVLGGGGFAAAARKGRKKRKKHVPPQTCFGTKDCRPPSDGQDFEDCNFAGESLGNCNGCNFRDADLGGADLSEGSYQGASFREANLRGANLEDSDVSGVSFRDACLVDSNLFDANIDGAHFGGAIFCRTIGPQGQVNNSGCDRGTDCCPTGADVECVKDTDCPGEETCVDGVCTIPNPTCLADPNACVDGFVSCGGSGDGTCFCYVTTEGDSRCLRINNVTNPFCTGVTCDSSEDCPSGQFCASLTTTSQPIPCGTCKICGPECPEFGASRESNEREVTPPRP